MSAKPEIGIRLAELSLQVRDVSGEIERIQVLHGRGVGVDPDSWDRMFGQIGKLVDQRDELRTLIHEERTLSGNSPE